MTQVTRRQFSGGVIGGLAALLLPRLELRPKVDLHAMASKWCAIEPYNRYDLSAPYIFDDHVYATDARAMVRFVDDFATANGDVRIPKETADIWRQFWCESGQWEPLRRQPQYVGSEDSCPLCIRREVPCPVCDGYGETLDEANCHACHGGGYKRNAHCELCHGQYDARLPTSVIFGDKLIGVEYFALMREVPGLVWTRGKFSESPIAWRSDIGMCGLVMPRMKP